MSESVLPMFSSRSFIVSGLTLRSLIHFEFIFVYGVRKCSAFIHITCHWEGKGRTVFGSREYSTQSLGPDLHSFVCFVFSKGKLRVFLFVCLFLY